MRINRIKLTDFRVYRRFEAELDRFNFFFGPNDMGKTSLALAVEFALTGLCDLTDGRGAGAEELIRQGAKEFQIEAEVEGLGRVRRIRSRRGQTLEVAGRAVPLAAGATAVPGLGVPREVLSAVLNASRFLELDDAGQRRLLTLALAGKAVDLPAEIRQALVAVGGYGKGAVENVADADALYKAAYEARTDFGRELKAIGPHDEPAATSGAPAHADAAATLRRLRSEKEDLASQRGRRVAAHEAAAKRAPAIVEELAEVRKQLLSNDEAARLDKLRDRKPEAARLERELAEARAEKRQAEAQRDSLAKLGGECPTCFRALKKAEVQQIFKALNDRAGQAQGRVAKAEAALAALEGVGEAEARLAAHRAAMVRESRLEAEQNALPALPESPDTSDLDERIGALAGRIEKGEAIVEELKRVEAERAAYAAWAAKKGELDRKLAACELVIAYAGPGGPLRAQLVGDQVGPFTDRLNAALARFGYKVRFSLDPYAMLVERNAVVLHPAQLSESGRFRFGIAFQVALATATGVGLIVADRADVLYRENRKALADVLLESKLDQAIVLATGEPPSGPAPPGVRLFSLALAGEPVAA